MTHDSAVEGITSDGNAVDTQDARTAILSRPKRGPEPHEAEVTRTPAEVADENKLVVVERALVLRGGRDRFVLELDVLEAGPPGGGP